MNEEEHTLAVFIDFENLALGFKGKKDKRFEIQKVLERLVEKGKIIVKKAYADWTGYADYKRALHEAAIELIDIPKRSMSGKNSADIRLCVDSIDLCYSKEHIDTFVIVSGDSDFSPLVSKLKENGKRVIGLGIKESSSNLLVDNCDEFIYYEDLERPLGTPPRIEQDLPEKKKEAFQLLVDSVVALVRENKEVLWSSLVKETMKRKKPSFNETYHGYRTFSDLLEDAEKEGVIQLRTDSRSGTYVIVDFGREKKRDKREEEKKERKTQKPRWRPRQRRPKPGAQAPEMSPPEPAPSEAVFPETEPVA
ncbi:MAG: NYN domain-containing protein [Thermodesulfobacteriota bacterium]